MEALISVIIASAGSALFAAIVCLVIRIGRGEEWNRREMALCRREYAPTFSRRTVSS
jgi:hypothetical protein